MDYLCAMFGDFSFGRFGFTVRTDRQTDRQTHRQTDRQTHRITDTGDRYTRAIIVVQSNDDRAKDKLTGRRRPRIIITK